MAHELSPSPQQANEAAFLSGLKDQVEMLKATTLGVGMVAAAYAVLASELSEILRVAGALACVFLGVWVNICAVIIYSRQQLNLRGVGRRLQAWRIIQFLALISCSLVAVSISADIAKQAIKREPVQSLGETVPTEQAAEQSGKAEPCHPLTTTNRLGKNTPPLCAGGTGG